MSSITRKNKRRVAFKCAKQGIAPAQAIAVSAAREIKATKEATAETMEVLLQAIALVAAHARRWLVRWHRAKTRFPSAWKSLSRRAKNGDYAH